MSFLIYSVVITFSTRQDNSIRRCSSNSIVTEIIVTTSGSLQVMPISTATKNAAEGHHDSESGDGKQDSGGGSDGTSHVVEKYVHAFSVTVFNCHNCKLMIFSKKRFFGN